MPALAGWLPGVGADVWCLQEVTRAPQDGPPVLEYREGAKRLEQRADLFGEVSALLPGHRGQFCAAMRGTLYDDAGRAHPSEFGIATFVRRDISVVEQVQVFVHGVFRADGWGEVPVPRPIHVMRLYDPGLGRMVCVAQFHGVREAAGKADTPARAAQAEAVAAAVQGLRKPGDAVVLCGDMNLMPDSESFARFADIGLCDLVTARGFRDTRTSHYPKAGRCADYMLVSADLACAPFRVVEEPEVSDHRPLILEIGQASAVGKMHNPRV